MVHALPELPYPRGALAPWIEESTMDIHYGKHHQGYVNKLNAALEGHANLLNMSVLELLKDLSLVPENIRQKVINTGGGVANHTFFWESLIKGASTPEGSLLELINRDFGSLEAFKQAFGTAAKTLFGSGWAWLVLDTGTLKITTTQNQDSPLSIGQTPLLTLDVWEHAYYVQFQNRRAEWVDQFWDYVNWKKVAERITA
jgi:Fe-Mn family superoxide dismutase